MTKNHSILFKHLGWITLLLIFETFASGQEIARPPISGFSHVSFYTTQADAAKNFYVNLLGMSPARQSGSYLVGRQRVTVIPENPPNPPSLLANIGFATTDVEAMRKYLEAHHVQVPPAVQKDSNGTRWFEVNDPEGNHIRFEQVTGKRPKTRDPLSSQLIHVGFMVHDRSAEDAFYREILGFRPYWFGGRTDDRVDWVALQVPEGHEWIEYMLTDKDAQMTPERLGVLNHFSLGVTDMKETAKQLEARGWTSNSRSHMQMGRDGKWQLNVYDPDGTRVEFMEFTPTQTPCCSPFTAPHPSANN
ncbi:MAG TPA: VOC family protein [Terriglobales bacterium]|nr:VOC family protein [Terriglobales bacterium]